MSTKKWAEVQFKCLELNEQSKMKKKKGLNTWKDVFASFLHIIENLSKHLNFLTMGI